MNILSNFIPNKVIIADGRDPLHLTTFIKTKIQCHNNIFNSYQKSSKTSSDYDML